MRAGPPLGVDAYGVRGCTRSCRGASTPSRHSFAHYCEGRTAHLLLSEYGKECFCAGGAHE